MEHYRLEQDADGRSRLSVSLRGRQLLLHNLYNRGTAFSKAERDAFDLAGLLPERVSTLAQQAERVYGFLQQKAEPLEKLIGLDAVEQRNAVLYYRVLCDHVEEFLPVVYTPTIGLACQRFSRNFRRGRGMWITPEHRGRIAEVLRNAPFEDVRLIVVTDNERILGLGDLGAGGMGIPVGKLALYTVGAGLHPSACLPLSLDVGTDNEELLNDPLYLGWPHKRLRGPEYESLVEEFVSAVKEVFPRAVLQWEDFKKGNAFKLLDRYRDSLPSFNDDIQGTAAVAVAGLAAAARISGVPLKDQRFVLLGAGAAGVGIARLLTSILKGQGLDEAEARGRIAMLDSRGLLVEGREIDDEHKLAFTWTKAQAAACDLTPQHAQSLEAVIKAFKPHALVGTSGTPGAFTEAVVRAMGESTERPAIFPMSNPTHYSEAKPADVIAWTSGRALIATGSPFEPVPFEGRSIPISQGNNVYIFPGVGLGAILAEATVICDEMLEAASVRLAELTDASRLAEGALFPRLRELRPISKEIALAVAREAVARGVAPKVDEATLQARMDAMFWEPLYPELVRTESA